MKSIAVIVFALGALTACDDAKRLSEPTQQSAPVTAAPATIKIVADEHGYTPSSVKPEKGKPATLEFTRTSDHTCAREVVVPELGIKRDLPLNQPVAIVLPTEASRSYTFQCGMAMYKGAVVVN